MRSNLKLSFAVLALVSTMLLVGCGGGGTGDGASELTEELIAPPVEEVQASGGFDSPVKIASGVSFTLSAPVGFKPGKFAAGQLAGQRYQQFKIDITNGSTAEIDLSTLIILGKSTGPCVDIFDGDNGMEGATGEPLAAGKLISFNWELSCYGKVGEDLSLILSNEGVPIIEVTGKIA